MANFNHMGEVPMKTSKITIDEFKKINNGLYYEESISKLKEKKG